MNEVTDTTERPRTCLLQSALDPAEKQRITRLPNEEQHEAARREIDEQQDAENFDGLS